MAVSYSGHGGFEKITGDPGVGKTLALRTYVDSLNENLFRPLYTPLSTLSRADLRMKTWPEVHTREHMKAGWIRGAARSDFCLQKSGRRQMEGRWGVECQREGKPEGGERKED